MFSIHTLGLELIQIRAACDTSRAKRIWWSKIFEILIDGETFSQLEHKPALYKLEGKLSRSLKLSLQQPPDNTAAGGTRKFHRFHHLLLWVGDAKNMPQYLTAIQRCSLQTLFVLNFLFLERRNQHQENISLLNIAFPQD